MRLLADWPAAVRSLVEMPDLSPKSMAVAGSEAIETLIESFAAGKGTPLSTGRSDPPAAEAAQRQQAQWRHIRQEGSFDVSQGREGFAAPCLTPLVLPGECRHLCCRTYTQSRIASSSPITMPLRSCCLLLTYASGSVVGPSIRCGRCACAEPGTLFPVAARDGDVASQDDPDDRFPEDLRLLEVISRQFSCQLPTHDLTMAILRQNTAEHSELRRVCCSTREQGRA